MLKQTFCHLKGIGPRKERELWRNGLSTWEDLVGPAGQDLPPQRRASMLRQIEASLEHLEQEQTSYFASTMPANQHWRLFAEFRHRTAYLDIETTGLGVPGDHITTIALYDGQDVKHYIYGHNLDQFPEDIQDYRLLVSFNGKCFDVPFLEQSFGIRMDQAHIDLRFVLKSLGYGGGLKACERQLGLDRGDLDGVDGYFAVLLWQEYIRSHSTSALETLLAYNIQDVLTLEALMVIAYNASLRDTPFAERLVLPAPPEATNPFQPHMPTVHRLRRMIMS